VGRAGEFGTAARSGLPWRWRAPGSLRSGHRFGPAAGTYDGRSKAKEKRAADGRRGRPAARPRVAAAAPSVRIEESPPVRFLSAQMRFFLCVRVNSKYHRGLSAKTKRFPVYNT
jgi:hypothetical protein